MDAESQVGKIDAGPREIPPQRPYALGLLILLGMILATASIFYR